MKQKIKMKMKQAVFQFLKDTINLDSHRGYIYFIDLPGENTGYGGSTFA